MNKRLIFIFVAVLAAAGCKPSAKSVIEERRAAVQVNLDRAMSIGKTVASVPRVTKDEMSVPGPVVFEPDIKENAAPTATMIHAEDIAELSAPVDHGYTSRLLYSRTLSDCASLLIKGKHLSDSNPNVFANVARAVLDNCKSVKYLFVIRTELKAAREYRGDVLAFDLASGKAYGGFGFAVQTSGRTDKVNNTQTTTKMTSVGGRPRYETTKTTTTTYVNSDESQLLQAASDAVEDGIEKLVPGATFGH